MNIILNKSDSLFSGDEKEYTITPILNNPIIIWTSKDPTIATVDNGIIKATNLISLDIKNTIITIKTIDGVYSAQIPISVIANDIKFSSDKYTLKAINKKLVFSNDIDKKINLLVNKKLITLKSSNDNIVSVSNGIITSKSSGTATITACCTMDDRVIDTTLVEVIISINSILINNPPNTIINGQSIQFTTTILPDTAANNNIIWSSSNSSIATINQTGLVEAKSVGIFKIKALSNDSSNKYSETTNITVLSSTINFSKRLYTINNNQLVFTTYNDKELLKHTTLNIVDNNNNIINSNIVNITDSNIISQNFGIVKIKASYKLDSTIIAYIYINVRQSAPKISVKNISINAINNNIFIGNQVNLVATIIPPAASNKNVIWESNNPLIATVNQSGVVQGISHGIAKITAVSEDGGLVANININVNVEE
jgi:uncharacterized protein YjdB